MLWIYFITARPRSAWVRFLKKLFEGYEEFRFVPVSFKAAGKKKVPDWALIVLLDIVGCGLTRRELTRLVRSLVLRGLIVVPFVPPHERIATLDALAKAGAAGIVEHGFGPDDEEQLTVLYDLLVVLGQQLRSLKVRNTVAVASKKQVK